MKSKTESVLIIDDESYIREFVGQVLSEHYRILFASTAAEGLETARKEKPSAIVLDLVLPDQNGIELCAQIRKTKELSETPILMLTGKNQPDERIQAFDSGADDYIAKPFFPHELLARVRAKINRSKSVVKASGSPQLVMKVNSFEVRYDLMKIYFKSKPLELGLTEFKILNCLLQSQGQVVDRAQINKFIWGDDVPSSRALDPHINALRRILKSTNADLKTIYGRGYSLVFRLSTAV